MIRFFKSIEKTLIFSLKAALFILLFAVFFGLYIFSIQPGNSELEELTRISRISVISMSTFAILGICFIRIYGGFAIGVKKSKEIISSLFLAAMMTDVISYLFLSIMIKDFASIYIAVMALIIQYVLIVCFTRFGNYIYFLINKPEECTVIYSNEELLSAYLSKIGKYKKQWKVSDVVHYTNEDLKQLIRKNNTIFLFDVPRGKRNDIIEYCYKHNKNMYILPDVADVVLKNAKHVLLDDTTVFSSMLSELSLEQRFLKRTMDIVISGIGLIIASPIMIIEAIVIKLYDHGPVFFKQERMTKGGKVFNVIKFRTMVVDAEKNNVAVLSSKNDNRVTPVGKILRATRVDELPQLINIFFGDMSIVGPRPERESIAEEYVKDLPQFKYRLKVKAGLTGLAQILGKYNTTPKDKLTLDLVYIEQYSIWLDLKLMFQTLMVLFKSDSTEGFNEDDRVEFIKHDAEMLIEQKEHE
ncbi:MAG: polyprenyl glycosylphosphotransferase [Oscillospiraceae bacterium]|jgi:exopolysaccharide biosynthesis polyprenyl glycosylphosphotransferase|nr:polyprenyl glycosylphosphotransferase [Oscillospiraceae bacterium]